jgi:3-oxoacyl-[acyl-carrier protein] reductase
MSLDGKIALVTGASRGLGHAIALELGRRGATVVGTATSERGALGIDEALAAQGLQGAGRVLDVTRPAAVIGELFKSVEKDFGSVQVLVNNAGITRDNLAMRMKAEEWDAVIATNLSAVFRVTQAALRPMLKARWGRIIGISSVVGLSGNPGQANYAAAKAGLIGMSKSLAREVATRGITVNTVAPGFIDTDMTRQLSDEQRQALLASVPAQRLGRPEDIAAAVAFLASDAAGYITGETLHVNGGLYMA